MKTKCKPTRTIQPSLFPEFEAELAKAEAEAKRQREDEERKARWQAMEGEFIDWLFDDAGYRERAQKATCPGKIIDIVTIDI